mgnify:CR=1 FL=1
MHEEEKIARQFYAELQKKFETFDENIQITIQGAGVHWSCKVKYDQRTCEIHCSRDHLFDEQKPSYAIHFLEDTNDAAFGRIDDPMKALQSVQLWIDQISLEAMYDHFEFVDLDKRNIIKIHQQILDFVPELETQANLRLIQKYSNFFELHMHKGGRSCELTGFGINSPIAFTFKAEETRLFESDGSLEELTRMAKNWLIDEWSPTELETTFPGLSTGKLASYYESGKLVEGEFMVSWDGIEKFFDECDSASFPVKQDVLGLIRAMRAKGYDHHLRAGQSLYSLVLSRARRHGLNGNQSCIQFGYQDALLTTNVDIKGERTTLITKIIYTQELEDLLENLKQQSID